MRAAICIAVLAVAAPAHANKWRDRQERFQGGAFLHYELTGLEALPDDDMTIEPRSNEVVLAGARLHGFLGTGPNIAYHIGLDLFAGGTIRDGGFAYDVALFPVGVIWRFGKTSFAGLGVGVQASGAVGTLDDAVALPLELTFEIGKAWRVLGRARVSYVGGADARQDGAPSIAFADELDAMLGLRIGKHYDSHGFPCGDGYFLAANYKEMAGTRFAGVTIGYSIDLAMPRRFTSQGE